MRFNRVLLLAASVNLAVLAMLFTISCSGDKGAKGKDADFSQCAIENGKLICGGTEIGELPGGGIEPGSDPCTLQGQILTCGDKSYDFSKSGCNVSEYMNRPGEVVQINCGGDISGLCAGVPFDFGTDYCDVSTTPYIVKQLPDCGGTKYSPNKGQACVSGAIQQCDDIDANFWSVSATQCGLDINYVECKGRGDSLVGVFYIGKKIDVRDTVINQTVKEYQGTQYCKYAGTPNAEISTCSADFGAGYMPASGKNFTDCELRANYLECSRLTGVVGAFDARTHICENANTATASIQECSVLMGFPQYTPDAGKDYTECKLADGFAACGDNNKGTVGVYNKQTQICASFGESTARIETCGPGMMPNGEGEAKQACVDGKTTCEGVLMGGYWNAAKQTCFVSKLASCYANNKNKSNCLYNGLTWTVNGTPSGAACDGQTPGYAGNGSFNGNEEGDAYFFNGDCYPNAKAYCDAEVGLWLAGSKVNAEETATGSGKFAATACKAFNELSEQECLGNGFLWGGLKSAFPAANGPTANGGSRGFCSNGKIEAKQTCERVAGGYVGGEGTAGKTGYLGWDAEAQECIKLNSSSKLTGVGTISGEKFFKNKAHCNASDYSWDDGTGRCFINLVDAERECGSNWTGNSCEGSMKTDPAKCEYNNFNSTCNVGGSPSFNPQHACKVGGFYWDFHAATPKCVEKLADCSVGAGADGQDCKTEGATVYAGKCDEFTDKYKETHYEVANGGFGLVQGNCVTLDLCNRFGGFFNTATKECVKQCPTGLISNVPIGYCGSLAVLGSAQGLGLQSVSFNATSKQATITLAPSTVPNAVWPNISDGALTDLKDDFADILTSGKSTEVTFMEIDMQKIVDTLSITLGNSATYYLAQENSALKQYLLTSSAEDNMEIHCNGTKTTATTCTKRYSVVTTNGSGTINNNEVFGMLLGKKAEAVKLTLWEFANGSASAAALSVSGSTGPWLDLEEGIDNETPALATDAVKIFTIVINNAGITILK